MVLAVKSINNQNPFRKLPPFQADCAQGLRSSGARAHSISIFPLEYFQHPASPGGLVLQIQKIRLNKPICPSLEKGVTLSVYCEISVWQPTEMAVKEKNYSSHNITSVKDSRMIITGFSLDCFFPLRVSIWELLFS